MKERTYVTGMDDLRHQAKDRATAALRKQKEAPVFGQGVGVKALVVRTGPRYCAVEVDGEKRRCRSLEGLAIGDYCSVQDDKVTSIHPRASVLSRPDPGNALLQKVLAANVDFVVVVASVGVPPLRPGLIDRCAVAAQHGGASPVVCVNKMDLLTDPAELAVLDGYRSAGIPVVLCSSITGQGVDELGVLLAGSMCVLAGHSGTGKSSLLNRLCEDATQTVGEVGTRGRHTTTSSSIHRMTNGGRIIDTPGVREFGLWQLPAAQLRLYFPEFVELADGCKFRDCTHTHEPECAVRDAELRRYPMYVRILADM